MNPCISMVWLLTLTLTLQAAPDMNFSGQMVSAVEELKQKIQNDQELKDRKLRLGKFSGPELPDSSFDAEFQLQFEKLMSDLITENSDFVISGQYDLLPSEISDNQGLQVIQFTIKIRNRQRRVLQEVTREINNSADIVKITGGTVALPDTKDVKKRNEAAAKPVFDPQFQLRDGTQVTTVENPNFSVEILKNGLPVQPREVNGNAFVDLEVTDTFKIALYNYQDNLDCCAKISIDGLDVANTFCTDGVKYTGYTIPKAIADEPGKHIVPGWLETTKRNTQNVYEFVINELGRGAATEMKSKNNNGVIVVEFFESATHPDDLPARNFGEVGKGDLMDVKYKVKKMSLRESPAATVSVRYRNRPE